MAARRNSLSSRARALNVQKGDKVNIGGKVWDASDFHSVRNQHTEQVLDKDQEDQATVDDRRFLQRGCQVKKKTRKRLVTSFKSRYMWVSEDLLLLRWAHGTTRDVEDSDEGLLWVEVANIGDVQPVKKKKLQFGLFLIDDPKNALIFQAPTQAERDRFVQCIRRLCVGELNYKLLWDERDAGTRIAVHWRAEDAWYMGHIRGFDRASSTHKIQFDDSKLRLYDLSRVFFRIEELPDARRDATVYDITQHTEIFDAADDRGSPTQQMLDSLQQDEKQDEKTAEEAKEEVHAAALAGPQALSMPLTPSRKKKPVPWIDVQKRVFTRWINYHLSTSPAASNCPRIVELFEDCRDCVAFCRLVEALDNGRLRDKAGGDVIESDAVVDETCRLENGNRFLRYCRESNVHLADTSAKDLTDGDESAVLDVLWRLVLVFPRENHSVHGVGRNDLLRWCKDTIARNNGAGNKHRGVHVQNFTKSWSDGRAFVALLHAHFPDEIDGPDECSAVGGPGHAVEQAFSVAESKLGVPRLLDVSDVADNPYPDEKSVATYVATLRLALLRNELMNDLGYTDPAGAGDGGEAKSSSSGDPLPATPVKVKASPGGPLLKHKGSSFSLKVGTPKGPPTMREDAPGAEPKLRRQVSMDAMKKRHDQEVADIEAENEEAKRTLEAVYEKKLQRMRRPDSVAQILTEARQEKERLAASHQSTEQELTRQIKTMRHAESVAAMVSTHDAKMKETVRHEAELKEMLRRQEAEASDLIKAELGKMEAKIAASGVAATAHEEAALAALREDLRAQLEREQRAHADTRAQGQALSESLAAEEARTRDLEARIAAMEAEIAQAEGKRVSKQKESLAAEHALLLAERAASSKKVTSLQKALQTQLEDERAVRAHMEKEAEGVRAKRDAAEAEVEALVARLEEEEARQVELRAALVASQQAAAAAGSKLHSTQEERDAHAEHERALTVDLELARAATQATQAELSETLQQEQAERHAVEEALAAERTQHMQELDTLRAAATREQLAAAQQVREQSEAEKAAAVQTAQDEHRRKIEAMRVQQAKLAEKNRRQHEIQVAELTAALANTEAESTLFKEQLSALRQEGGGKESEAKAREAKLLGDMHVLEAAKLKLQTELERAVDRERALADKEAAAKAEQAALTASLAAEQGKQRELEAQVAELTARAEASQKEADARAAEASRQQAAQAVKLAEAEAAVATAQAAAANSAAAATDEQRAAEAAAQAAVEKAKRGHSAALAAVQEQKRAAAAAAAAEAEKGEKLKIELEQSQAQVSALEARVKQEVEARDQQAAEARALLAAEAKTKAEKYEAAIHREQERAAKLKADLDASRRRAEEAEAKQLEAEAAAEKASVQADEAATALEEASSSLSSAAAAKDHAQRGAAANLKAMEEAHAAEAAEAATAAAAQARKVEAEHAALLQRIAKLEADRQREHDMAESKLDEVKQSTAAQLAKVRKRAEESDRAHAARVAELAAEHDVAEERRRHAEAVEAEKSAAEAEHVAQLQRLEAEAGEKLERRRQQHEEEMLAMQLTHASSTDDMQKTISDLQKDVGRLNREIAEQTRKLEEERKQHHKLMDEYATAAAANKGAADDKMLDGEDEAMGFGREAPPSPLAAARALRKKKGRKKKKKKQRQPQETSDEVLKAEASSSSSSPPQWCWLLLALLVLLLLSSGAVVVDRAASKRSGALSSMFASSGPATTMQGHTPVTTTSVDTRQAIAAAVAKRESTLAKRHRQAWVQAAQTAKRAHASALSIKDREAKAAAKTQLQQAQAAAKLQLQEAQAERKKSEAALAAAHAAALAALEKRLATKHSDALQRAAASQSACKPALQAQADAEKQRAKAADKAHAAALGKKDADMAKREAYFKAQLANAEATRKAASDACSAAAKKAAGDCATQLAKREAYFKEQLANAEATRKAASGACSTAAKQATRDFNRALARCRSSKAGGGAVGVGYDVDCIPAMYI